MKTDFTEEQKYIRAKKKVDEIKGFYWNLLSYCLVIPFLIFVNLMTSPGYQWFWWPMLGWGIGLLFHGYKVYVNDGVFGRNWERKKIEKYMREEEDKNRWN